MLYFLWCMQWCVKNKTCIGIILYIVCDYLAEDDSKHVINSLWSSDTLWRYKTGLILAQVMAWCLAANLCWLFIKDPQWQSPGTIFHKRDLSLRLNLNQCWLRSVMPYDIIRPQWVNLLVYRILLHPSVFVIVFFVSGKLIEKITLLWCPFLDLYPCCVSNISWSKLVFLFINLSVDVRVVCKMR